MIPIILIGFITIVLTIGAIIAVFSAFHREGEVVFGAILLSSIICVVPSLILGVTIGEHAKNLANVRNGDAFIEIKEMAIKDIDQQISDLSKLKYDTALLNADSPITALVAAKSEFVRALSHERDLVLQQKTKIDAREIGLMGAIVDWYGKE